MTDLGRILISGTHSGCGTTTVTVAILAALAARGVPLAGFTCGVADADPVLECRALGLPVQRLDPYFCRPEHLTESLALHGTNCLSIIEGVLGYYDSFGDSPASTYDVARTTGTPTVLVLDTRGLETSAGAILAGFTNFRESSGIAGVIVNQSSPSRAAFFDNLIMDAGLLPLGCLPHHDGIAGATTRPGPASAVDPDAVDLLLHELAQLAEDHLNLHQLRKLARQTLPLPSPTRSAEPVFELV